MNHPSSRRAGYAAVLGGCLVLFSNEARAEGAASRLHLRYEAPPDCPSRQELLTALDSRIQTSWVDGSDTRSFDVRVARAPDGSFIGRLEIHQGNGVPNAPPPTRSTTSAPPPTRSSAREIRGESCKAVMTSVAVFIAIALDPESEGAPPEREEPPVVEEREEGHHRREEATPPKNDLVALRGPRPRPPPRTERETPTVWTWSTGYALGYVRSPQPGWSHRLDAQLAWGEARARLLPAVRLSWGWADFSTFPPLAGEAHFRRKTVRVEGCGRFVVPPFAAAACAGLDAGTLTATAPDLPRFAQAATRWSAATGTLRGSWSFASWLEVELSVGALLPFERPRFTVQEPHRIVYRAPMAVFDGTAGLGVVARFQ